MTIESVTTNSIETVLNGQGSVVTVMGLCILAMGFICWFFIRDSSNRQASLYADNKALTERIFNVIENNGRIISALTEALKNVQSK